MRIAKWAGNRRRKASQGLHFLQEWFFIALGSCVAVLLVLLGLLMAAGRAFIPSSVSQRQYHSNPDGTLEPRGPLYTGCFFA